jgi:nicotinamidase-related amidase
MITEIDPKTALVLIDLQKGIVGLPVVHPATEIIAKCVELLAAFRDKNLPVVIVHVNPLGAKWTQARVESPSAPKGDEAVQQARIAMTQAGFFDIVPQITIQPDDILVTKTTWGAYYDTNLDKELKSRGVTGIVLAGIATSIGVEGTARQASELGYNITFANDAMTDMHLSGHAHSISTIFPRIGEVGGTAEIIEKIQQLA